MSASGIEWVSVPLVAESWMVAGPRVAVPLALMVMSWTVCPSGTLASMQLTPGGSDPTLKVTAP